MTTVKNIDTFIELSSTLLHARPDTTRVSTTYTHRGTKPAAGEKPTTTTPVVRPGARVAKMYVKTFDPVTGAVFKCVVSKSNQLSRVMSALGPRGVEITKKTGAKRVPGLANVMSGRLNVEYTEKDDEEPQQQQQSQQQQQQSQSQPAQSGGGSKKKKKGKK